MLRNKNQKKHIILLPIETIAREIDWKLHLAAMCLKNNNTIYMGQHTYLFGLGKFIKNGIYLGKNSMSRKINGGWDSSVHCRLKRNGFKIIHLDEEGAVYHGWKDEWKEKLIKVRVDVNSLSKDDTIFTWGNFQADVYKNNTEVDASNIHVTGHPRFDLLRGRYVTYFSKQAAELKEQYHDFILVNGNFSYYTNALGLEDIFSARMGYDEKDLSKRLSYLEKWGHCGKTLIEYIKMVLVISSRFPDMNIIFRPHPAEDPSIYHHAFKGCDNVNVIREGAAPKWILASKAVIHDGCTTGLESFLAGKVSINYSPHFSRENQLYLTNSCGIFCRSHEELFDILDQVNTGVSLIKKNKKISDEARSLLNNLNEKDFSFNYISNYISELESSIKNSIYNHFYFYIYKCLKDTVALMKTIARTVSKRRRMRNNAFKSMFPGFKAEDINEKVRILEEMYEKKIDCRIINKKLIRFRLLD